MLPDDRDAGYLWDMVDAARAVADFTSAVRLGAYTRDRKLRMAVERGVEIIGEAGRTLTPSNRRPQKSAGLWAFGELRKSNAGQPEEV